MAVKIIAFAAFAVIFSQTSAQLFGGVQRTPFGGTNQQVGYKAGPAWGSLSQSHDFRGFSSPITVGGGADYLSKQGHGLSGSFAMQPGLGGQGSLRGQLGVLNTPNHQVNAFAQHDRFLTKDFKPFGPQTNSLGVNYLNKNGGGSAFVSGSKTGGLPATGTVGGSIPLYNMKNGQISATGQSTFGHGMKPNHQIGIQGTLNF